MGDGCWVCASWGSGCSWSEGVVLVASIVRGHCVLGSWHRVLVVSWVAGLVGMDACGFLGVAILPSWRPLGSRPWVGVRVGRWGDLVGLGSSAWGVGMLSGICCRGDLGMLCRGLLGTRLSRGGSRARSCRAGRRLGSSPASRVPCWGTSTGQGCGSRVSREPSIGTPGGTPWGTPWGTTWGTSRWGTVLRAYWATCWWTWTSRGSWAGTPGEMATGVLLAGGLSSRGFIMLDSCHLRGICVAGG